MFWKSKQQDNSDPEQNTKIPVVTIPKEFYAGANPVIKFKTVEKNIIEKSLVKAAPVPTPAPKQPVVPVVPKPTPAISTAPATTPKTAVGLFGNRKFLIIGSIGLFLIFVSGAGLYYWWQLRGSGIVPPKEITKAPEIKPEQNTVVIPPPPTSTPEVTVSSTPNVVETVIPSSTPSLEGGVVEYPSVLLGSSVDLDRDGLTDAEEELFTTDPGKTDSDGDGYDDSTEVFNLYAPTVEAPARLISTQLVTDYSNPRFNYRLYYPSSWIPANVDPDYRDVLFSTVTGENVEVRVFDRDNLSFNDWFSKWAPDQNLGSVNDFKTVFKTSGRSRNDNLVFYFEDAQHFYVIVYHITGSSTVNFREVIAMMARSFRVPSAVEATFPEQKIILPAVAP